MKPDAPPQTKIVLVVEDDPDHAFLAMNAIAEAGVPADVHHVADGEKAMSFLHRVGDFVDAPRPDLILLDLNMPRMNGFEVMRGMRADPTLRSLPVVVLSTSADPVDRSTMHDLGCHAFLRKPAGFAELGSLLESIG